MVSRYKQHATSATKQELETRLGDMDSLSSEISKARQQTVLLSDDLKEWREDFTMFYESWNDMKMAISRLIEEKGGFNETDEKLRDLNDFVEEVDLVNVITSDHSKMHSNLSKLNALKERIVELEPVFQKVLIKKRDLGEFGNIWVGLPDLINERIIKQNTSIENLRHFNNDFEKIWNQLDTLDKTFKSDLFVIGEIQTLKEQCDDYDRYATDLKKVEIDVISAKNFSEIIVRETDANHKDVIQNQILELSDFYTRVLNIYQKNSKKLHQIVTETDQILKRVEQTEFWLNDLEMNTPKLKNEDITNSNELFQIKSKFLTLKETCDKETIKFRELNETGGDLLLQIDELVPQKQNNKYTYLARKFTKLNARWSEVTGLVYARSALLEHVSSQLGEFKRLIVSESGYLDKLEKALGNCSENADCEEIIEQMDVSIHFNNGHFETVFFLNHRILRTS